MILDNGLDRGEGGDVHSRIRIGVGSGFADDRIDPAVDLVERGELDFLVFECLAERTIALAQLERRHDPEAGFDPLLRERMEAVLGACSTQGVRIVTNAGAANPLGAARAIAEVARSLGIVGLRVGTVVGDDVLDLVDLPGAISANAYLGADGIVAALDRGADVVVTGRVADASLFLGPLAHAHGWALDDWPRVAVGLAVGHLLECAGQVTGGYHADPGYLDVDGLADLGFPFADVDTDGRVEISKLPGTGGCVTVRTCTEQLFYEVHDPTRYETPDATVDFADVRLAQLGPDRVELSGVRASPPPRQLKVSVGFLAGFVAEGEISYAGPGCVERADLALSILEKRLSNDRTDAMELSFERIGVDSVWRGLPTRSPDPAPPEVRVRVAARVTTRAEAEWIGREVTALWLNGPAGGGGASRQVHEQVAIRSTFLDRDRVQPTVHVTEV